MYGGVRNLATSRLSVLPVVYRAGGNGKTGQIGVAERLQGFYREGFYLGFGDGLHFAPVCTFPNCLYVSEQGFINLILFIYKV